jgi:chromosomal replication initiation ATPase DnaA
MTQLAIPLPHRAAMGRADFLVSAANEQALQWIERWPRWPAGALVLTGPPGSGKSHLAHLWLARSGGRLVAGAALGDASPEVLARGPAVALDDAEAAPERALLHFFNSLAAAGASLLVAARQPPSAWQIALPDLASRLRAVPSVTILPPDDALIAAVLVKHFADRQLAVAPGVIGFLVRRMERSLATAGALASRLDEAALSLGRPVTVALARRVLAESAAQPSPSSDFGVA